MRVHSFVIAMAEDPHSAYSSAIHPPLVATVAGIVAIVSIIVTKSIARKRAAIDLFLKTDMDKGMVDAHVAF